MISAVCDEENSAVHMGLGIFFPNILLSGIIWPVQGYQLIFRYYIIIIKIIINTFLYYYLQRRNAKFLAQNRVLHATNIRNRITAKCLDSGLGNRETRSLYRNSRNMWMDCRIHYSEPRYTPHSQIYWLMFKTGDKYPKTGCIIQFILTILKGP